MYIHVEHLTADMELESDVRLKAGSYLVTRKDLGGGKLPPPVIEAIRKFGPQLNPESFMVDVRLDENTLKALQRLLAADIASIEVEIQSGLEYPDFMKNLELKDKISRVIEKIISNPNIIKAMYELKAVSGGEKLSPERQLLNHSVRVMLLAVALGLQMRCSIVSLINVGMAAILHDMGIIKNSFFRELKNLDDFAPQELERFVQEHQQDGVGLFEKQKMDLLPFTRQDIMQMISNHHRPPAGETRFRTTYLLYFAELVDEMISELPHKIRYNFNQEQLARLGERFHGRVGLANLILGLIKLYKDKESPEWKIVCALIRLLSMHELLVEGYEEKLRDILQASTYKCAVAYPSLGGNSMPRTIYCNGSLDPEFKCENLSQVRIDIYSELGRVKSYFKCTKLTEQLQALNRSGREEAETLKKSK